QADAAVARNSLQAITVMATYHINASKKGEPGLGCHLKLKPDLFLGILQSLLQVGMW
ncbi:unnamed protein product, partial [Discosporangium mesarthrocarpum]